MALASRRQFITHTLAGATALGLPTALLHAQSRPVLKAGDQKGGLRALLEAAGGLEGLAYDIQWSEFPAASAKISGASPIGPESTAPALSASASGAAAGNSDHWMS